METIQDFFVNAISSKLQRKSIQSCSRWAEMYRMMGSPIPGPWSFKYHPWLLEMHDAEEDQLIGQKSAQMGYTEWAMNYAFFNMDVNGLSVLYILPSSDDASDFSSGRFDPALELSPHLSQFFAANNNVGLKRAGETVLYVRGSHSRSKLKSIPTPIIIYDEVDEMSQQNIALAGERQSGQFFKKDLKLSTPTIKNFGINREYENSTQEHFYFKCPKCSRHTELVYPDCLVVTADSLTDPKLKESHLICKECKNKLEHELKHEFLKHKLRGGTGHFIKSYSNRDPRGFHVNQLYSSTMEPARFAISVLRARTDPTDEQELWNSKLGLPHAVRGGKIDAEQIENAKGQFVKRTSQSEKICTLGIDVGSVLHMVVYEWTLEQYRTPGLILNDEAKARVIFEGTTSGRANDFDEALDIFDAFNVMYCIVDAEPERRSAYQFATKRWGRIHLCDYLWSQTGRAISESTEEEITLKVNRTSWMDMTLGRYKNGTIKIPVDVSRDFCDHIKEPTRIYKKDKFGNPYGYYENVSADHFAHASTYAEIGLQFAVAIATSQDIKDLF